MLQKLYVLYKPLLREKHKSKSQKELIQTNHLLSRFKKLYFLSRGHEENFMQKGGREGGGGK